MVGADDHRTHRMDTRVDVSLRVQLIKVSEFFATEIKIVILPNAPIKVIKERIGKCLDFGIERFAICKTAFFHGDIRLVVPRDYTAQNAACTTIDTRDQSVECCRVVGDKPCTYSTVTGSAALGQFDNAVYIVSQGILDRGNCLADVMQKARRVAKVGYDTIKPELLGNSSRHVGYGPRMFNQRLSIALG